MLVWLRIRAETDELAVETPVRPLPNVVREDGQAAALIQHP